MPRKARLDLPGTLHHVMMRGIEGSPIFRDDEDRKAFLDRLHRLIIETGTRVLAWALMDNHVHLLIISGPIGLSTFMRRLLTGYAYTFNRRHNRTGHLFQNRYKSIVCDLDEYLLELVRYIHLNPLRANRVKTLEELEEYPWCGHGRVIRKGNEGWQEREYVLGFFGTQEKEAVNAYRKFMNAGKDQGQRPELDGGGLVRSNGGWSRVLSLKQQGAVESFDDRILGKSDFVQDILTETDQRLARQIKARKETGLIVQWIKEKCKEAGVSDTELKSGSRRRAVSAVRKQVCLFLSREMGLSLAEIARVVGIGTTGVAMAINRKENLQK